MHLNLIFYNIFPLPKHGKNVLSEENGVRTRSSIRISFQFQKLRASVNNSISSSVEETRTASSAVPQFDNMAEREG